MNNRIWLFFGTIIFFVCCHNRSTKSSEAPKEIYKSEELKADLDIFKATLKEGHPGLYRFKSERVVDSLFEVTASLLTREMTDREFTLVLSRIVAQLGDGHLRVSLPKKDRDKLDLGPTAPPFRVYWDDNKLYVWKNFSSLPDKDFLGAQLVSINGHLVSDFLREFYEIAPADGNNMTHKYRMIQRSRLFTRYLNYLYGYAVSFEIAYIPPGETVARTANLDGLVFDNLLKIFKKRYAADEAKPWVKLDILDSGLYALLRIASFDKNQLQKEKVDFPAFLETTFKKLKTNNIQNLILDLRGNGGGTDEYGKLLFSYFTAQQFDYYESLRMNKESYDFFRYTSRPDMKAPAGMLKPNNVGTFDNVQHPNYGKQNPAFPTFTGNIYVLIDGNCFSTTSEFLSKLDYATKAVFIGEESGGNYYGNCSGPTPDVTLPNTKVSFEIPLVNYRMAVKDYPYNNSGLIPDYPVSVSIQDLLSGKDPQLDFAQKLIRK